MARFSARLEPIEGGTFVVIPNDADVEIPSELGDVRAKDPAARVVFDALAPSRRREHADQVAAAKRAETRLRRAADVVTRLGR